MKNQVLIERILVLSSVFMIATLVFDGSNRPVVAKPNWQVEWEKTVKAAKKEGEVRVYSNRSGSVIVSSGVFQKTFPGIKVVSVAPGRGAQAVQRLMAERRAGKYLGDVIIGGSSTPRLMYQAKGLDPIKPTLILPEVIDVSKWWEGTHRYIEPEREYIFMYLGHPQRGSISYNTNLVNPKEFKSLWDFINPKWKGKIVVRDFRIGGSGQQNMKFFYYHPALGPKFIRRFFSEMDVTLFRNIRLAVDWLATGRYAMCFFCRGTEVVKAQRQGLPVAEFGFMKEGAALTSHSGTVSLVNKAPHPNAAKVFINWLLSRNRQLTVQKISATNSLRVDIPKDMVASLGRIREGGQVRGGGDPGTDVHEAYYQGF